MTRPARPLVTALQCAAFRLPLPRPWGPEVPDVRLVVTSIEADDGSTGTGFSWTPQIGAHAVLAMLEHDLADRVVGLPCHPTTVWDTLWRQVHEAGGGGVTTIALAGVDIALWDLEARRAGMPLVDLLGRRHDDAEVYGSGVNLHYPLEQLVEQAQRWVAAGHQGVKIKVGRRELAEDVERVAAVREVIGPRRRLMVDANQRWDVPGARRALRALSRFDLHWVEEPLLADDVAGHAALRSLVDVPVAVGENLHTVHRFGEFLSAGACDVVQPNVVRVGGISPFRRIADLAATGGTEVAPHLLPDLSGQLALTLDRPVAVEDVEDASFAALGALARPSGVRIVDGRLTAETPPGHGLVFAVDEMPGL